MRDFQLDNGVEDCIIKFIEYYGEDRTTITNDKWLDFKQTGELNNIWRRTHRSYMPDNVADYIFKYLVAYYKAKRHFLKIPDELESKSPLQLKIDEFSKVYEELLVLSIKEAENRKFETAATKCEFGLAITNLIESGNPSSSTELTKFLPTYHNLSTKLISTSDELSEEVMNLGAKITNLVNNTTHLLELEENINTITDSLFVSLIKIDSA